MIIYGIHGVSGHVRIRIDCRKITVIVYTVIQYHLVGLKVPGLIRQGQTTGDHEDPMRHSKHLQIFRKIGGISIL